MEHIYLGNSGFKVPKYILGTIPFSGTNGFEHAGDIKEDDARRHVDMCLDAGINMFDTANLYSKGDAEKVLGAAVKGRRDQVLISSKTGGNIGGDPNSYGASRHNIENSIHRTLQRLDTDYLDLYFVHLWDGRTPVEETIQAMNDLVKSGKSGIGAFQTTAAGHSPELIQWRSRMVPFLQSPSRYTIHRKHVRPNMNC